MTVRRLRDKIKRNSQRSYTRNNILTLVCVPQKMELAKCFVRTFECRAYIGRYCGWYESLQWNLYVRYNTTCNPSYHTCHSESWQKLFCYYYYFTVYFVGSTVFMLPMFCHSRIRFLSAIIWRVRRTRIVYACIPEHLCHYTFYVYKCYAAIYPTAMNVLPTTHKPIIKCRVLTGKKEDFGEKKKKKNVTVSPAW